MRVAVLLLTVLTGATALVYEVTWQKYLATLLGSDSEATAAVLGLFLAGLSIGYGLFGRLTRSLVSRPRPPRLLRAYGFVEGGIGVYAVSFPFLFGLVQQLSFRIPHGASGVGFGCDVLLAAVLILPPTILMGGTIPMLTQALSRSLADATRFHALVYAFNTAGAVFGALAAGFFLVPWLGLRGVMVAMGTVNIAVGVTLLGLGANASAVAALAPVSQTTRSAGFASYVCVALLTGFAMMVVETVLIRIAGFSFGSSQFTFSMVVAVFVFGIASGSFLVSLLPQIPRHLLLADFSFLIVLLYLVHPILGVAPFWVHVLRTTFTSTGIAFYPFQLAGFLAILVVVGPAVVLSGATLPLLFHHLRSRVGDLGAVAGTLYGWNTIGSLFGALVGGYLLLFWVNLDQVYRIALAALALATAILLVQVYGFSRPSAAFLLALILGALWMKAPWDPRQLSVGLFRDRQLLPVRYYNPTSVMRFKEGGATLKFYKDDPTSSIAVYEYSPPGQARSLGILTNGKPDSQTSADRPTTGLLALLPALMADRLEDVFVIGYGTGVTVGELAALRSTRKVVVAEISQAVVDAAPLFDPLNLHALQKPEVQIVRSDAYRALLRSDGQYDAIISEPSNPWVTGVEMLYCREFLEAAKSRLRSGGVYLQWFHQYEMDAPTVDLVLRTYASVFDAMAVWYGLGSDLLLLGLTGPASAVDLQRMETRAGQPDVVAGLRRAGIGSFPELLGHELLPVGVVNAAGLQGPLHTLLHPRLSDQAGRAFFEGTVGRLPFTGYGEPARVGVRNSLLRRYAARFGGVLPDAVYETITQQACLHRTPQCAALLADWGVHYPDSLALQRAAAAPKLAELVFGDPIAPGAVESIRDLLGGSPASTSALSPELAQRATDTYWSYYFHGVDFEGRRLMDLWERCTAPSEECARGRTNAQLLLQNGVQ